MSNLSIQNLFGPAQPDAPTRGTRTDGGRDQRDAAQAFNEVMQRHTARAPERSPDRGQERNTERTPERAREPSADRGPDHSQERPAARQSENAPGTPASSTVSNQRPADASANSSATPAKRPSNAQAPSKNAQTQDTTGPDTATGDLFADLNLALSKAAAPTEDAAAAASTDSASQPGQPNATASPVIAAAGTANTPAHAGGHAPGDAQATAAAVIDAAHSNAKAGAASKKAADANAVGAAQDKAAAADKAQAKGLESLAALASPTHTNTSTRSENNPLSLSAALANPPVHAAHALASSLSPTTTFSIGHAQVKTGVGAYGFAEDFSQRVVMLANQRVQSAEIALTPSDLGPVSVSLEMRGQEASLVFGAAQTATRAAIEDALPRLREMFQAQGLHLVDAQVSTQLSQHGQREAYGQNAGQSQGGGTAHHQARGHASTGLEGIGAAGDGSTPRIIGQSNRLIDVHV